MPQTIKFKQYALPLIVFAAVIVSVLVIAKHVYKANKAPRPVVSIPPQLERPLSPVAPVSASSELGNEQPAQFLPSSEAYPAQSDAAEWDSGVGLPAYEGDKERYAYV